MRRFASRQPESFSAKVQAALRNEFGGHAVEAAEQEQRMTMHGATPLEPAARGPAAAAHARAVRGRRLRRVGRPDGAQARCRRSTTWRASACCPAGFSVVGFARREWTDEPFRAEMKEAVAKYSREPLDEDLWDSFARGLHYVSGSFDDASAYVALGERLARRMQRTAPAGTGCSTWRRRPTHTRRSRRGWARLAWCAAAATVDGRAWSSRSRSGTTSARRASSTRRSAWCSASGRSIASTTTWAKRRSRTSWCSGSPTASSSRSGTAATSTTCRSPWRRRSASKAAAATTRKRARCATWCRTTCCRCSALVAMEPVASFRGDAVRDEKAKVFQAIRPIEDVGRDTVRGQYTAGAILGAARARLPRRGRRRAALDDRDVRRAEAVHRQLALGRRAVLPAHRQAPAEAGDRGRHHVQDGAAASLPADGRRRTRRPTCWCCASSRTRASRCGSARRCRARGPTCGR